MHPAAAPHQMLPARCAPAAFTLMRGGGVLWSYSRDARAYAATGQPTRRGRKPRDNASNPHDVRVQPDPAASFERPQTTAPGRSDHQITLEQGPTDAAFSNVEGWVAFADLHVSHRSIEVCMEVLRKVHDEARQRGAGVLFLGEWYCYGVGEYPVWWQARKRGAGVPFLGVWLAARYYEGEKNMLVCAMGAAPP